MQSERGLGLALGKEWPIGPPGMVLRGHCTLVSPDGGRELDAAYSTTSSPLDCSMDGSVAKIRTLFLWEKQPLGNGKKK